MERAAGELSEGSRVTIVDHHVSCFRGLEGVVLGRADGCNWRVWVTRKEPVMCGPMTPVSKSVERCSACGTEMPAAPGMPRTEHHWFDPSDLHSFVVEVNGSNLEVRR